MCMNLLACAGIYNACTGIYMLVQAYAGIYVLGNDEALCCAIL